MTLKRIVATAIVVTAIAATLLASIVQPASADELRREGGVSIVVGFGDFTTGAPQPFHRNHPTHDEIFDEEAAWAAHVERCYERYARYDERTDSFIGFDGNEHFCLK